MGKVQVESVLITMQGLLNVYDAAKSVYPVGSTQYNRFTSRVYGEILAEMDLCRCDLEQIIYGEKGHEKIYEEIAS